MKALPRLFRETGRKAHTDFARSFFERQQLTGLHEGAIDSSFTTWLAGGGIQGGVTYGESDEWSYKAALSSTYCYDVHATVLHLLGVDHTKLTFRHNGIDRRLTDVHGEVIGGILDA